MAPRVHVRSGHHRLQNLVSDVDRQCRYAAFARLRFFGASVSGSSAASGTAALRPRPKDLAKLD